MRALAALVVFASLAAAARAEGLEATKALRCALAEVSECDASATCNDVTFEQIELPDAVRVNFADKLLASTESDRSSPIQNVETFENVLVLQGSQNGRGWTMVIERATGRLAATIADVDGSFVISGGCAVE
jgi:hypothetical protein